MHFIILRAAKFPDLSVGASSAWLERLAPELITRMAERRVYSADRLEAVDQASIAQHKSPRRGVSDKMIDQSELCGQGVCF